MLLSERNVTSRLCGSCDNLSRNPEPKRFWATNFRKSLPTQSPDSVPRESHPRCNFPQYPDPCCQLADFDADNDTDFTNFGRYQLAFTDPG